ncbi:MAG: glycogen debranching enzyme GlgX, partial [Bacteroidetes bacterium]|nr:glycogen debranching enzyme GlgX [Bacteroidota bacterium]
MDKTTVLGAYLDQNGVNFSIFSANADRVELVLLDEEHSLERTIDVNGRTGDVWHVYVPGIQAGQRYAYRVHGPWAPDEGHRFNSAKLLLDPYARAISRMPVWDDSLFGHDRNRDDRALNPVD